MQKQIKGTTIGPILNSLEQVENNMSTIVNELNNCLTFEGEIASDILDFYGEEIKDKCLNSIEKDTLSVGSAVITHSLPPVIHVVVCEKGEKSDYLELCDAVRNSLLLAETNQLNSITLPPIGACAGGLTSKEAIFTIMEHVQYVVYNASFEYLKQIQFYAKNDKEREIFEKYFNEIFG
jgi:O-acetyl-ADP-ribose deacetylase (regulator of RNase III)